MRKKGLAYPRVGTWRELSFHREEAKIYPRTGPLGSRLQPHYGETVWCSKMRKMRRGWVAGLVCLWMSKSPKR
jgi:hypothetical protein